MTHYKASDVLSLETRLQVWILRRFPLLEPEIQIDFESTEGSRYLIIDLGILISQSEWDQIQKGVEELQVDLSQILIYSVSLDGHYPHEWLYGVLDYLQAQLQIDAVYVLELYQRLGLDLKLHDDPVTVVGREDAKPKVEDHVSISSDGDSLLINLSFSLRSELFDINSYYEALVTRFQQHLSSLWRSGVVRIPRPQQSLVELWNLVSVKSPLLSFEALDLYQPPMVLQDPVPILLNLIRQREWVSFVYNLNPVQRHFIALELPQVFFDYRNPVGTSTVWVPIPSDHQGWSWYSEVQTRIESALSRAIGSVELTSYATRDVAQDAAEESQNFQPVETNLDVAVYQVWSLNLPYVVSFLQRPKNIGSAPPCGQAPIVFGASIPMESINEYSEGVMSVQSQIKYLVHTHFSRIPTSISSMKRHTDQLLTIFIPMQNGQRIWVPIRTWSEIFWRFDLKTTIVGYGPVGHQVAQVIADSRLKVFADRVQCKTKHTKLIQKFQMLFQAVLGSRSATVTHGFDGISILRELAPAFRFELMYSSQLFSLIAPTQAQTTGEWCRYSTDRIRRNLLPLWRVSGPWSTMVNDDLSRVVLEAAAFFAFARTVVQFPALNNFAGQIRTASDGSVEVPVFSVDQGLVFQQEISEILQEELQVKLADSWENALELRLSAPGRIIIPYRADFYVVSRTFIGEPLNRVEIINAIQNQLSICREGRDPVQGKKFSELNLEELQTVILLEGPDPWCLMADSAYAEGVERFTSLRFLTQVNLTSLVLQGIYSGVVPGLLPILSEELLPTTGEIRLDSSPREGFLDATAYLVTSEREFPIYQFLFEADQIHLKGVEDILNLAWKQGLLWNAWGRELYKKTGTISRTPVVQTPLEVRDSPELGLDFLVALENLI